MRGSSDRRQMRAYARVQTSRDRVRSLSKMLSAAMTEYHKDIADAASTGITHAGLAETTGFSEGRIWQIVNSWNRHGGKEKTI